MRTDTKILVNPNEWWIGVNKDGRKKRRSQSTMLFNGYDQHNMQQIAALTKVHPISNGAVLVLWLWLAVSIAVIKNQLFYCNRHKWKVKHILSEISEYNNRK